MQYIILNNEITAEYMQPSTAGANAVDLRACIKEALTIRPGQQQVINTGIAIELPENTAGLILPRSGKGVSGLVLGNLTGNIDPDYRGEVKVCLWNRSMKNHTIEPLERIAQLMVVNTYSPNMWRRVTKLSETDRGENGFGSTGNN